MADYPKHSFNIDLVSFILSNLDFKFNWFLKPIGLLFFKIHLKLLVKYNKCT